MKAKIERIETKEFKPFKLTLSFENVRHFRLFTHLMFHPKLYKVLNLFLTDHEITDLSTTISEGSGNKFLTDKSWNRIKAQIDQILQGE